MSERPGKAFGLEGLLELQKDLPKNQHKILDDKKDVVTTMRSVGEDQKKSDAGTFAWKESDEEIIGKSFYCGLLNRTFIRVP